MSRFALVCVMSLALIMTGCAMVSTEPQVVRWYGPKQDSVLNNVEYSGEYRLWEAAIGVEGTPLPKGLVIASVRLKPGDPLGFTRSTTNQPVALAGSQAYAIRPDGQYVWQMNADGGQMDREKNKNNAVFVAAVAGCVVLIIVGIAFTVG